MMELTTEDKQRIVEAARQPLYSYNDRRMFIQGAEYATIYEREQQVALQTENSIYFQERNEAWKQNAQLEAERSELQDKYKSLWLSVQRFHQTLIARNYNNIGVWHNERQEYNYELISEVEALLNSLKTK